MKLFPVYFFESLVIGLISEYTSGLGIHNTGLANVVTIIEFNFYFYVLLQIITNPKVRRYTFHSEKGGV
jgi:hypothetical protein